MPVTLSESMSILVCGSLAYDTLLSFPHRFQDHLLPERLHKLSVCFMVPNLRREFGGCAGNIAHNLHLLGGAPLIMSTVGEDFAPYRAYLEHKGLSTRMIVNAPGCYTSQCFITSDSENNQITAFHPGALDVAPLNHVLDAGPVKLAIVAPSGYSADLAQSRQLAAAGIPFVFDPGQELPLFSREELLELTGLAHWVTLNDYEAALMLERTGLSIAEIAERVEALIVTHGSTGSDIYAEGRCYHIGVASADAVVDPTGCGDAYRAGVLYGLAQGYDWQTIGQLASVLGAIKIASRGAQNHHFDWAQIQARYRAAFACELPEAA